MRLLLVEDEPDLGEMMREALGYRGHVVDWAQTGLDALHLARQEQYDVAILDIGLPDISGLEVCRLIRDDQPEIGLVMLTGRADVPQRVEGLDAGADDYLPKPVSLAELDARLRALGRRTSRPVIDVVAVHDLVVDPAARQVHRQGSPVAVTGREYALIELRARRAGQVVRREELVTQLWDVAAQVSDNALDVLIAGVRRKLDAPFTGSQLLETVRGVGYRLR